jgi:hypothetical protein
MGLDVDGPMVARLGSGFWLAIAWLAGIYFKARNAIDSVY